MNSRLQVPWIKCTYGVTGAEKWFDATTDENGNYILNLPDGEFQITGVWVDSESKWYPLDVSFTVQDGVVDNSEVLNLDLTEKKPNTNGFILKDGQPVTCLGKCPYGYR